MQQGLLFSRLTQGGVGKVLFAFLSSTKIVTGIARNSGWSRLSKNVSIARILNSIDQYQQPNFSLFLIKAYLLSMMITRVGITRITIHPSTFRGSLYFLIQNLFETVQCLASRCQQIAHLLTFLCGQILRLPIKCNIPSTTNRVHKCQIDRHLKSAIQKYEMIFQFDHAEIGF